jgi:hypothetical protein
VLAPVVCAGPVVGEFAYPVERDAVIPAHAWQLVGPTGPAQPDGQVVQLDLGTSMRKGLITLVPVVVEIGVMSR